MRLRFEIISDSTFSNHLPLVASLTPPEFQVETIDEYFGDVPFNDPADLTGTSFMTPEAPGAYQLLHPLERLWNMLTR